MFYTYVLKSLKDHNLYVGLTGDLKQRLEEHRKGRVESTKNRLPLILIYYEACLERGDAAKREKYLKTYHGKMFLRNRLKSYLTGRVSLTANAPLRLFAAFAPCSTCPLKLQRRRMLCAVLRYGKGD